MIQPCFRLASALLSVSFQYGHMSHFAPLTTDRRIAQQMRESQVRTLRYDDASSRRASTKYSYTTHGREFYRRGNRLNPPWSLGAKSSMIFPNQHPDLTGSRDRLLIGECARLGSSSSSQALLERTSSVMGSSMGMLDRPWASSSTASTWDLCNAHGMENRPPLTKSAPAP